MEEGSPQTGTRVWRPQAEGPLVAGSALLIVSNASILITAVLSFLGWSLGAVAWVVLALDPIGVALLAIVFWSLADAVRGRPRRFRRAAAIFLSAWVGLAVTWRFLIPGALGTDIPALLGQIMTISDQVPPDLAPSIPAINAILALWAGGAVLFVLAQACAYIGLRRDGADDWARELPATTWLLAAVVSLAGTLVLVLSLASQLQGQPAGSLLAGALLKLILAPNLFITAYFSSLQLGLGGNREPERTSTGRLLVATTESPEEL